jgi:hypothetical protein
MNKYVIDYDYGVADFYTEESDPPGTPTDIEITEPMSISAVRREFYHCANACFGIRKSLGDFHLKATYPGVLLPAPYEGHGGTHFLSHHGDEILFDSHYEQGFGEYWKLHIEGGGWCSCRERGKAQLDCEVHHFWVTDHDTLCQERH